MPRTRQLAIIAEPVARAVGAAVVSPALQRGNGYPDGVAATVTGCATSAGSTSSGGQMYTASRRE